MVSPTLPGLVNSLRSRFPCGSGSSCRFVCMIQKPGFPAPRPRSGGSGGLRGRHSPSGAGNHIARMRRVPVAAAGAPAQCRIDRRKPSRAPALTVGGWSTRSCGARRPGKRSAFPILRRYKKRDIPAQADISRAITAARSDAPHRTRFALEHIFLKAEENDT